MILDDMILYYFTVTVLHSFQRLFKRISSNMADSSNSMVNFLNEKLGNENWFNAKIFEDVDLKRFVQIFTTERGADSRKKIIECVHENCSEKKTWATFRTHYFKG